MQSDHLKILIVEDDIHLAYEWREDLRNYGHEVDHVSSADDVPALLGNDYDCFIVDLYHKKNKDFLRDGGIRSISPIRKHAKNHGGKPLIIAVSGHVLEQGENHVPTEQVVLALGANALLKKPISAEKINKKIDELR